MSSAGSGTAQGIPAFNWGAFLLAPIWGVAHGQWPGIFFPPLWVFVANMLRGPRPLGAWTLALGGSMALVTIGFQVIYARNANAVAWARASERMSVGSFVRRQRYWAFAGALVFTVMVVWIVLFLSRGATDVGAATLTPSMSLYIEVAYRGRVGS